MRGVLVLPILTVDSPDEEALVRAIDAFLDTWFHRKFLGQLSKSLRPKFLWSRQNFARSKAVKPGGAQRCFRIAAGVGRDNYLALSADEFVKA